MAITIQTFKILKHFEKEILNFGEILSLGRLDILISDADFKKYQIPHTLNKFADNNYFFNFKFKNLKSLDVSSFEKSDIIHDLNRPITCHHEQFDTIIDFGTSEHVFNIVQNLKNISTLCKINGHIIHCLPANNNCGHGFWQFSPELFFQLYKKNNGYFNTEVFLIDMLEKNKFYKVENYTYQERLEFNSDVPLYIVVKTKKIDKNNFNEVFQSDYEVQWKDKNSSIRKKNIFSRYYKNIRTVYKKKLKTFPFFQDIFFKKEEKRFYKKKNFLKSRFIKRLKL